MKRKDVNKLDKVWADKVKEKAHHSCEHCGIRGVRMEAAHVVGRRHRATRWGAFIEIKLVSGSTFLKYDLCGHCLCHSCHQQYDEHGPLEGEIVLKTIGLERKEALGVIARKLVAKHQDYDNILETLEEFHAA